MPEYTRVARVAFTIHYEEADHLTPDELMDEVAAWARRHLHYYSSGEHAVMGDGAEIVEWEPEEGAAPPENWYDKQAREARERLARGEGLCPPLQRRADAN